MIFEEATVPKTQETISGIKEIEVQHMFRWGDEEEDDENGGMRRRFQYK
jgi:hypothetical protein